MTTPSLAGQPAQAALPAQDEFKDLGFGAEVARGPHRRLLNRNGGFNVVLDGLNPLSSLSLYHWLLTITWPQFLAFIAAGYIALISLCSSPGVLCQCPPLCYNRLRKHHPGWSSSEPSSYHRGAAEHRRCRACHRG